MTDALRRAACIVAAVLAAGCATRATVVLLPDAEGKPAEVSVRQGDSQVVLDKPYATANVTAIGVREAALDANEVQSRFGSAIAAQPARPQTFVLYFVEGKEEFVSLQVSDAGPSDAYELAIVKRLVEAHGGMTIHGLGGTFTFTLPRAPRVSAFPVPAP